MTRAVGQTLKEKKKEIIFGIFENECHTVGRPDKHNKMKENIFLLLDFFFYFL